MSPEPGLQTLFQQTSKLPLLTPRQEVDLAMRRDHGDPVAVRTLVEHNIRLSVWRAKRWQGRGLPFEDLIQEGVFGLERAAQKFDPARGIRFSTYATTWVDHFMQRALSREDIVPYIVRRRRLKADELLKAGCTVPEIAKRLKCKELDVVEALESSNILASLDDESSLYERLAVPEPDDEATAIRVRDAIGCLPPLEREFMGRRFGLGPNEAHRKSDAAKAIGLSGREATEVEARAVGALRAMLSDLEHAAPNEPCVTLGPEDLEVICRR
jgi:RNA polymerase primary sigma factor